MNCLSDLGVDYTIGVQKYIYEKWHSSRRIEITIYFCDSIVENNDFIFLNNTLITKPTLILQLLILKMFNIKMIKNTFHSPASCIMHWNYAMIIYYGCLTYSIKASKYNRALLHMIYCFGHQIYSYQVTTCRQEI